MEMTVTGKLMLASEEVTITVTGEKVLYSEGPAEAYNKAKETIIAAEEERRAKLENEKEDKD